MKKICLAAIAVFFSSWVMAGPRPNIIWLMAEDISLDLGCYGMKAVKTPNLDGLAAEGVRFDNCFVTNSICSPSRSSMMVGVHQLHTNTQHHRSNRDVLLDPQFKPFTYWLRQAGYTCILGHHGVMRNGRKIDVNFKYDMLGSWDGVKNFGLFDKLDTFTRADEPFFAQIQLLATHRGDWWNEVRAQSKHPVNPDLVQLPDFLADDPVVRLDWAKYLDQMEYIDAEVGMIREELKQKGMDDHTIIIFIGDNGRCNLRGKGYLYDSGLHIPLIVYYPEGLAGGQVRKDVVSSTDITATILDWAGAELPDYLTGSPMFGKQFQREYVFGARDLWDEVMEKSRAITSGEWKYIRNDKPDIPYDDHQAYLEFYRPALHVMRRLNEAGKLNEAQKLFFSKEKPKEELYHLTTDPQELHNLANDPDYRVMLQNLRNKTTVIETKMKPVSDVFHPVHPVSVDLLKWVKETKPELYQQMLDGVEIGFQSLIKEYKNSQKMPQNP